MTRDDITRMAREAGLGWVDADAQLELFAALAYAAGAAAERNKLAAWMMAQGYATGHGNSMEDLLIELTWQINERKAENETQRS